MKELKVLFTRSNGMTLRKVKLAAQSAVEQRKFINNFEKSLSGVANQARNDYYLKLSQVSGNSGNNIFQKISRWTKAFVFNIEELKDVSNFITKSELSTVMDNMLKKIKISK